MTTATEYNPNKLDEVKNIIFGENIKEYDAQLNQLQSVLQQNRSEILNKMEEVRKHLMQTIQVTEQNLIERLKALQDAADEELKRQDKAHVSRQTLSETFNRLANSLEA